MSPSCELFVLANAVNALFVVEHAVLLLQDLSKEFGSVIVIGSFFVFRSIAEQIFL